MLYASRLASVLAIAGSVLVLFWSTQLRFSEDTFVHWYATGVFVASILYYFVSIFFIEDTMIEKLNNCSSRRRWAEWFIRLLMLLAIYAFSIIVPLITETHKRLSFTIFLIVMYAGYFAWDYLVRGVLSPNRTFWHDLTRTDLYNLLGSLGLAGVLWLPNMFVGRKDFIIAWSGVFYLLALRKFFLGSNRAGVRWLVESHSRLG